jgi:hypothetical protein
MATPMKQTKTPSRVAQPTRPSNTAKHHVAHQEHERVHADEVRADDGEDIVVHVVEVVDHHGTGEGHDPHHHAPARLGRHQRRDHARAAQDLAHGRRVRGHLHRLVAQEGRDRLGVGAHRCDQREPDELEPGGGQPQRCQRVAGQVALCQPGG